MRFSRSGHYAGRAARPRAQALGLRAGEGPRTLKGPPRMSVEALPTVMEAAHA